VLDSGGAGGELVRATLELRTHTQPSRRRVLRSLLSLGSFLWQRFRCPGRSSCMNWWFSTGDHAECSRASYSGGKNKQDLTLSPITRAAGLWLTCCLPALPGPSPQSCSPAGPPQPVLMHGVVPAQVQDPALALVELHQVPLCPTLQPVQGLLL